MEQTRPKVGIGVLVFKGGKVFLGKRKGVHAANVYAGPGGHLEFMESFIECAKRETREEMGIEIGNIRFLCLTNFKTYASEHYVNIGLAADWISGEPRVCEPGKCGGWDLYDLDDLPTPLFGVVRNYVESYKTGRNYYDA